MRKGNKFKRAAALSNKQYRKLWQQSMAAIEVGRACAVYFGTMPRLIEAAMLAKQDLLRIYASAAIGQQLKDGRGMTIYAREVFSPPSRVG